MPRCRRQSDLEYALTPRPHVSHLPFRHAGHENGGRQVIQQCAYIKNHGSHSPDASRSPPPFSPSPRRSSSRTSPRKPPPQIRPQLKQPRPSPSPKRPRSGPPSLRSLLPARKTRSHPLTQSISSTARISTNGSRRRTTPLRSGLSPTASSP